MIDTHSGNIGKPENHTPGHYSQDNSGGYVEERLSKLEYNQQEIANHVNAVKQPGCIFCKEQVLLGPLPICHECSDTIGKMSIARRNLKFVF